MHCTFGLQIGVLTWGMGGGGEEGLKGLKQWVKLWVSVELACLMLLVSAIVQQDLAALQ